MERIMFKLKSMLIILLLSIALSLSSCKQQVQTTVEPFSIEHAEWVYNATIYEVNIRQFTPEGTFEAFEKHLPRLKDLGIKILWLMPIHPIGEVERKGSLGSYYSVKDYKGINPEFGTLEDFVRLVNKAHELDMKVIIDWVANHTSHDNHLVYEHPDWYDRDSLGNLISPFDWSDVVQLNYNNHEMREYMIGALKYWIEVADIDGYRCDVAAMVPTDFWNTASEELNELKEIFMLAEADEVELQEYAFNADYAWEFHHIMNDIAKGKKSVLDIDQYYQRELAKYPKNTIRMHFTSNHDENSWAATEFERLGAATKTFAALKFVLPGMPLLYNGQEAGFNRMLKFFDKDVIDWNDNSEFAPFYKKLIDLKTSNTALYAANKGADMVRVNTSNDVNVFAFIRENDNDKVFAVFNLSNLEQVIDVTDNSHVGTYTELFTNEAIEFSEPTKLKLKPWEYRIYVK
jgi:glycosidase